MRLPFRCIYTLLLLIINMRCIVKSSVAITRLVLSKSANACPGTSASPLPEGLVWSHPFGTLPFVIMTSSHRTCNWRRFPTCHAPSNTASIVQSSSCSSEPTRAHFQMPGTVMPLDLSHHRFSNDIGIVKLA